MKRFRVYDKWLHETLNNLTPETIHTETERTCGSAT